jgi:hypothetical protein
MSILFFGKATHGWNAAMRELWGEGKPIPRRMRDALRAGVAADRAELDYIEAALEKSDAIDAERKSERNGARRKAQARSERDG